MKRARVDETGVRRVQRKHGHCVQHTHSPNKAWGLRLTKTAQLQGCNARALSTCERVGVGGRARPRSAEKWESRRARWERGRRLLPQTTGGQKGRTVFPDALTLGASWKEERRLPAMASYTAGSLTGAVSPSTSPLCGSLYNHIRRFKQSLPPPPFSKRTN